MTTEKGITVHLVSFGYETAQKCKSDITFNLRNVPNPTQSLIDKGLTGEHKQLRDDLFKNPIVVEHFQDCYEKVLELIRTDGQTSEKDITIAFGCHRGKHRSVAYVEKMAELLNESDDLTVTKSHQSLHNQYKNRKSDRKKASTSKHMKFVNEAHE